MEDDVWDNKRAAVCLLHLQALVQEVDQLERCVDRVVTLDGVKQKCNDIDMTRGMIVQSARKLRQYKCDEWANAIYNQYSADTSDHREGRYD